MNDASMPGRTTSGPELTNVSAHGMWLLYGGRELYLPFSDFPWFMEASIRQLAAVSEPRSGSLRWGELDVDLSIEAIDNPAAYPMVARAAAAVRERRIPETLRRDRRRADALPIPAGRPPLPNH